MRKKQSKYLDQKSKLIESLYYYINNNDEFKFKKSSKTYEDIFKSYFSFIKKINWQKIEKDYPVLKNRFVFQSIKNIEKDFLDLFRKSVTTENDIIAFDIIENTDNIVTLSFENDNIPIFNKFTVLYNRYYIMSEDRNFVERLLKHIILFYDDLIFFKFRFLLKIEIDYTKKALINNFILISFREYFELIKNIIQKDNFEAFKLSTELLLNAKGTMLLSNVHSLISEKQKIKESNIENADEVLFDLDIKLKLEKNPDYLFNMFSFSLFSYLINTYRRKEMNKEKYLKYKEPFVLIGRLDSSLLFENILLYLTEELIQKKEWSIIGQMYSIDTDEFIFSFSVFLLKYKPLYDDVEKTIVKNKIFDSQILYLLKNIIINVENIINEYDVIWYPILEIGKKEFSNRTDKLLEKLNKLLKQ